MHDPDDMRGPRGLNGVSHSSDGASHQGAATLHGTDHHRSTSPERGRDTRLETSSSAPQSTRGLSRAARSANPDSEIAEGRLPSGLPSADHVRVENAPLVVPTMWR